MEKKEPPKKPKCRDCSFCQYCSESRCAMCRPKTDGRARKCCTKKPHQPLFRPY